MSTSTDNSVSRRDFLKLSGATAALALLGGQLGSLSQPAFKHDPARARAQAGAVWKAGYCPGCHQPTCAIKVKVVDGVAVEVMGDPASPTNAGRLCPRGLSLAMNTYSAYRIKAPLKRTNPDRTLAADPGWVEISWEEALSTVAARLKEIYDSNPRSLLYMSGFGREEESVGFSSAFGASSTGHAGSLCPEHFASLAMNGSMLDRLDLERSNYVVQVGGSRGAGFVTSDASAHWNAAIARGMRVVNVDPHSTNANRFGEWAPIRPGTEVAFGLALLNTIIHEIHEYDRWWLRLRSNAPYLLPIEKTYIKGTRVFTADFVRDPETNKPLVWDSAQSTAVPFDASNGETYALLGRYTVNGQPVQTVFQALSDYVKDFTPEWASTVTTLPAAQIRDIAANLVKEARIGSTIEIDGFTFPYSPAVVDMRRAMASHVLGTEAYKALVAVNVLLGNADVPGGLQAMSTAIAPGGFTPFLTADEDGILKAQFNMANQLMGREFAWPPSYGLDTYYPHAHSTGQWTWKAILDPAAYHIEYPIKAIFVHGSNPIINGCNNKYVLEGFRTMPFVAAISYIFDEPTQLADIVMPEGSPLETTSTYRLFRNEKEAVDATRGLYVSFVKHQMLARMYDTRDKNNILLDLAQRLGILPAVNKAANRSLIRSDRQGLRGEFALAEDQVYTWEEMVLRKLQSDWGKGTTFADFAEHAFRASPLGPVSESYNYITAPDNAVRLPLYFHRNWRSFQSIQKGCAENGVTIPFQDMDQVARHYTAFPIWYEPPGYGSIPDYPLYAIQWKDNFTNQNTLDRVGNPLIHDIIDQFDPWAKMVHVPAGFAAQMGLVEGEEIWVESIYGGKTKGRAHITQLMHPEVIGISGNYGKLGTLQNPQAREGAYFNILRSPEEADCDPFSGSPTVAPRVKIYRA
jgi:anaerobic selenocysteine-containing dehydrogenase